MSIKGEILSNFKSYLENLGIFTKVERGLISLADAKKWKFPLCVFNSLKVETKSIEYNTATYRLYVDLRIYNQTSKSDNYFDTLDNLQEEVLKTFNCLEPNTIHSKLINIQVIQSDEPINDEYIDGLYEIRFVIIFDYRI